MPQSTITVILPVYQLAGRGLERVQRSLYSIALNTVVPPVIVMDGSRPDQFAAVDAMTRGFPFVQHVAHPLQRFNMPVLFNRGIERARTSYLFCTGAAHHCRRCGRGRADGHAGPGAGRQAELPCH